MSQCLLKVGVLVETSRGYGRGILRGVTAFARQEASWSIYHQERSLADTNPSWLHRWQGSGILARLDSKSLVAKILKLQIPVVGITGAHWSSEIPLVQSDETAIVQSALQHFLDRGFTQFAYCGFPGAYYSDSRRDIFQQLLAEQGMVCHTFLPRRHRAARSTPGAEDQGMRDDTAMAKWIARLPKPIAILACNDIRGQHLLNVCRELGVSVPDEVAVLGIDDDDFICELCNPPLSSVRQDTFQIGFEAAQLLHQLMQGDVVPQHQVKVPPIEIRCRLSTDVIALEDREVAMALTYIRNHATSNLLVRDVLYHVQISQSTLERRFMAALGRTPKQEIDRVRLEAIRRLLAETQWKIAHVAQHLGFKHAEYLAAFVKVHTGQTPQQWRKELQNLR